MTKFKVNTEHCFFDYFPVAFRFEDLCLCESHAKEVLEKLTAAQQSVQADGLTPSELGVYMAGGDYALREKREQKARR